MSLSILKKLNCILDKGQKTKIAILLVLTLIGGILETVSVSCVLPLISAILDEQRFASNKYVIWAMEKFGIDSISGFVYVLLMLLAVMFVAKNAYLVLLTYLQSRFVNTNRSRCTTNLLSQFLHRPYEYYLYAETSVVVRTVYGDMDNVFNLLLQCMNFTVELVVSICLAIFLCIIDVKMMLVVTALLGVATIIILKVIKPRLGTIGDNARDAQAGMYKWILQPSTGIKDVKVFNKEEYCTERYREQATAYADYQVGNNVLTTLPRLLIETVTIVGVLVYVGISMAVGVPTSKLISLITAFALAAMRLLPSVNRVNTYTANIAYFEPALNYIYENITADELKDRDDVFNRSVTPNGDDLPIADKNILVDENKDHLSTEDDLRNRYNDTQILVNKDKCLTLRDEIRLENITFAYPNSKKNIFKDADMLIPVGKSIGVVGPSGAGKTTIIDILLGLLKVQEGKITSDGQDILEDYSTWLAHIGYIPQNIFMLDASIKENIAFGVKPDEIDEERVWAVLEQAQMKDFVLKQSEGLDSQIGERGIRISGGQKQRLGIARALYHDPELLIFDEATSALDNDTETAIMEAIDSLHGQKTLVIIAHRLRTIENCDIIYEVKDEKIEKKNDP